MIKVELKQNWHEELTKEVLSNPEMRAEYEAFKLQLELAHKMKSFREKKHLTQADGAKIMGTQKPTISRLESEGRN